MHGLLLPSHSGSSASVIAVPLVLEYEDAALRHLDALPYTAGDVRDIIDYLCAVSEPQPIYYLWRPYLPDPKDDMVLEAAVAGGCDTIVTFNRRDFRGIGRFGLRHQTPADFLTEIER